jgi:hypothetical protein
MEAWLAEIERHLTQLASNLRWPFTTLTGLLLAFLLVGWVLWIRGHRARVRMRAAQRQRNEAETRRIEAEVRIAKARRNLGEQRVWMQAPELLTAEERQQHAAQLEQRPAR